MLKFCNFTHSVANELAIGLTKSASSLSVLVVVYFLLLLEEHMAATIFFSELG